MLSLAQPPRTRVATGSSQERKARVLLPCLRQENGEKGKQVVPQGFREPGSPKGRSFLKLYFRKWVRRRLRPGRGRHQRPWMRRRLCSVLRGGKRPHGPRLGQAQVLHERGRRSSMGHGAWGRGIRFRLTYIQILNIREPTLVKGMGR